MNKLVIYAVVGLVILGIVIGGYYFVQNSQSADSQNQPTGENKATEIPSDYALKLFNALERGLNG
jgi:hypothetical protein